MVDFQELEGARFEINWRRWVNQTTESIALIANVGGKGVVLEYYGPGIDAEIDAVGRELDNLGLDDALEGLSIWEGHNHTSQSNTPENGIDYETELVGKFREMTPLEWEAFRDTGVPWKFVVDQVGTRKNHGCSCTWIENPQSCSVEDTVEGCGLHYMWARKHVEPLRQAPPLVLDGPWRAGRSIGRTLYVAGKVVGMVDTPELAAQIVGAMNGEAAGAPRPSPSFNHTRSDGPFDPCSECLALMDRDQLFALIKDQRATIDNYRENDE